MSTEKVLTKIILMIIAYVEYTTLVHASVNESTTPLNSMLLKVETWPGVDCQMIALPD